jgi:hypothetical protein
MEIESLTHLNMQDCPLVTEQGKHANLILLDLFDLVESKQGQRFKLVKASGSIYSDRVAAALNK